MTTEGRAELPLDANMGECAGTVTAWGLWHDDGAGGGWFGNEEGPWLFDDQREAAQAKIAILQILHIGITIQEYGADPGDADLYYAGKITAVNLGK